MALGPPVSGQGLPLKQAACGLLTPHLSLAVTASSRRASTSRPGWSQGPAPSPRAGHHVRETGAIRTWTFGYRVRVTQDPMRGGCPAASVPSATWTRAGVGGGGRPSLESHKPQTRSASAPSEGGLPLPFVLKARVWAPTQVQTSPCCCRIGELVPKGGTGSGRAGRVCARRKAGAGEDSPVGPQG